MLDLSKEEAKLQELKQYLACMLRVLVIDLQTAVVIADLNQV